MGPDGTRENVQLIAYADRFGGDLRGLHEILDGPLAGLFGGLHILLFFTLNADFSSCHSTLTWTGPDGELHSAHCLLRLDALTP